MWSFETDPDFQQELDWIDQFVRNEVEPWTMYWVASGTSMTRSSSAW